MRGLCAGALAALVGVFVQTLSADVWYSRAGYWDVAGSPRRVTSLNPGWTFSLDGFRTAKTVSLPHSIDEGEIGFAASGGVNRQQPAWYRKTLSWSGGSARQFLHFEAIMGKSRITLNGREVAAHFGGFLPIHVEVTGLLTRGENRLEVWCDNSDDPTFPPGKPQDQLDFAYFGGIYRDAWLVETGDAYVTDAGRGGVYVSSRLGADGGWTVFADVTLGGATNGATARFAYDGTPVTPPFRPARPALWSPEEPNLHLLTVEVVRDGQVTDAVGVRFGIRDFTLDANGLTLNGRRYPKKLIGVNRHQDYLFIGMALPNALHWRDVKKYKDCGMTVFRNAHYPQDPAFMDACDALGMFVIVNTPGWQFWNRDDPVFERRVYDDIVQMVRRDRSRPSLLMWEPVLNETRFPAAFVTNAVRLVRRETRAPNYCACDSIAAGADVCDVAYVHGARRVSSVRGADAKATFCREWGDFPDDWNAQNSSSRVAREWGEGPMVAQAWHYMEETYWPSLKTIRETPPGHFGATLWHGADHARGYHPDNFFGGLLSYGRQKKYAWQAFKAALTEKPFVFVAHELAPYSPADITVYSNCAYTATWLGKPFVPGETKFRYCEMQALTYDGAHPERQRQAVLDIRLPDGSSVVKARAKRFAQIDLALDTEGLAPTADGSDLVALTATLADADGTPRRYARETVVFEVEGPAEIVGENPQETRWGEAIVLIRPKAVATPQPITVRARLVRQGTYARQGGFLTFTPGSLDVRTGTRDAGEETRRLKEVEEQQRDFNVTAPASAPSLAPVLDADVIVPNGGVFRFFDFGGFKKENMPRLVRVFDESPYQDFSPMRYDRLNWFELERGPGDYLFDAVIEPKLKKCVAERARLFLGLACNSGSISVTQMHEGRALATPVYVFERCAAEGHPFRPCDQYGPSWVPDYDSPFLLERHRALLRAFAAWLERPVSGTSVRRKDVIYGIEARYAGYWGEGAMRLEHYPKSTLLDDYIETYLTAFPDTLICMGGHETLQLPTRAAYARNPSDAVARRAMAHVGKVFRARNRRGPVGFFIDSWQTPSDQYDATSDRVLFGADGAVQSLADAFFGSVYRRRYVTGEFGYLTFLSDPSLQPYEKFPEQVATRGVSGLTLHNFTAKDRASLAGVTRVRGAHYLPGGIPLSDEVYARVRRALAGVGYRIVLGSPKVERLAQGVRASFTLTNVGASRMFHDYNRIHLIARDAAGRVVEDRALDFRLADLPPAARPLLWDEAAGAAFAEVFPSDVVEVRIRIPDEKGIEHPLCLSNRGRDADGAYVL